MAEVAPASLRPRCDPASFAFETTAEVAPYVGLIGQDRAIEALKFGLAIDSKGFNIVVSGEAGTGRTTALREYLQLVSATKGPSDEWLYVNNFQDPHRPSAIRMPPGKGREFARQMADMIAEAREVIPRTFQSEDYEARRTQIIGSVQRQRETLFAGLAERARQAGFQLQGSPAGFFLIPLSADGQPMDDQAFMALAQEERDALMRRRDELMAMLRPLARQGQTDEAEANRRLAELQRTVAQNVVDMLVNRFFEDYAEHGQVIQYMIELSKDMIDNVELFLRPEPQPGMPSGMPPGMPFPTPAVAASAFRKYEVNLLVDCSAEECATVVFETNPTPQRLLGRIEKEASFGTVATDFTMIRAGSLHRANGGYLVFDFDDMLMYPLSWNEMKRTIRTGEITIEEIGDRLGYIETRTIRPEPIPWTGKVVAVCRESIYRVLYTLDPEFRELFKVKANFDNRIERTPENEAAYAGLIAGVTQRESLLPLNRDAVARVVEEGMRMASDHTKLSIRFGDITDIVREAAHWAEAEGADHVTAAHIRKAIDQRSSRVDVVEVNFREAVARDVIRVETTGEVIGQVNGLSVVDVGDARFGQPSRITATAGLGQEGVIDIQREALLSGPIHTKAVLTLQGFLFDRYAAETPLTLDARISFEQSYGLIEGDSATVAEVCALLSRLAEVPVKQSLAMTGSMDQRGSVQAVGGVNEKVEGFYDVCNERGLTGEQGVIIPASNVQHLMLREDVVDAVRDGRFRVYAVSTMDEAMELLTGRQMGEKGPDGVYPPDSINGLVLTRLRRYAEQVKAFLHHR